MGVFVQRDAPQALRDAIRGWVEPGLRVRSELPDGWTVKAGPTVTVVGDGTPSSSLALSAENVRVSVYAEHRPVARRLAQLIDAYLLDPRLTRGFHISAGPGLLCVRDSDTGGWVCSVTVVAESTKEGL